MRVSNPTLPSRPKLALLKHMTQQLGNTIGQHM